MPDKNPMPMSGGKERAEENDNLSIQSIRDCLAEQEKRLNGANDKLSRSFSDLSSILCPTQGVDKKETSDDPGNDCLWGIIDRLNVATGLYEALNEKIRKLVGSS